MPRSAYQDPNTLEWCIPLTRGYIAIVDEQDVGHLIQWSWYTHCPKGGYTVYGMRNVRIGGRRTTRALHVELAVVMGLDLSLGMEVDHIDHNGLNNRRANLRLATHAQNMRNRVRAVGHNTSGAKGVRWHTAAQK